MTGLKIIALLGVIVAAHVWRWKIFVGSLPLLAVFWANFPCSDRSAMLVSILTGIAMAWIVMLVTIPTTRDSDAIRKRNR